MDSNTNPIADRDSDQHNVAARQGDRLQIENDVDAFLNSGGKIAAVATGFRADPPKRPESNYGRGAI